MLVLGAILGLGVAAWAGHPALGAQNLVPMFVARANDQPSDITASGMGYASVLKPALSAVVNIASSKIVKTLGGGVPFGRF